MLSEERQQGQIVGTNAMKSGENLLLLLLLLRGQDLTDRKHADGP